MKDKRISWLLLAVMAGMQYFCYYQNPFTDWELPFATGLRPADTSSGNLLLIMYAYLPVPFILLLFSGDMQRLLAGYGLLLSVRGEKRYRLLLQVERKMIVQVFASVFLTGIVYTIGRKDTWEILTTVQRLWVLLLYGLAVCALIQLQYLLELYTDVQYALGIVLVGGALSLFISGSCRGNQEVINSLLFLNLGFARKNGIIPVAQQGISPELALLTLTAIFLCTIGITLKVFRKRDMI